MKTSNFTLIYNDENIIAVNKASGISVSPDRWDESKERLDKIIENEFNISKIYIIHRIDKETSGIVMFAKNAAFHRELSVAFEKRLVAKRYTAIVHGRPSWKEAECDLALVPNGNKKHLTIIDKYRGKESLTKFRYLNSAGNYSVLEAMPMTGRIHQIRVHAAAIGHPVVCDSLYGKETPVKLSSFKRGYRGDKNEERPLLARLGLHAKELLLPDGKELTADLPKDMSSLIKQMEKFKRT